MDLQERRLLAALAASERTRRVLLFLQTYSVLLCIVCLNITDWGYKERRALVQDARDLYTCATPPSFVRNLANPTSSGPSPPTGNAGAPVPHLLARPGAKPEKDALSWSAACANNVGLPQERATAVGKWIFARRLSSRDVDQEMGRVETDMRANVYNVPIPLTGMHIDINSFSLIGAAGHMLLLVWLLLSIHQEQRNLERIDRESVDLVVRQMLFFPADGDRGKAAYTWMRVSAAGAVLAPLVPLGVMACSDVSKLSAYRDWFPSIERMVATELLFVVFGTAVALWCVRALWGTAEIVTRRTTPGDCLPGVAPSPCQKLKALPEVSPLPPTTEDVAPS